MLYMLQWVSSETVRGEKQFLCLEVMAADKEVLIQELTESDWGGPLCI